MDFESKLDLRAWTGLIWLRIGTDCCCEHDNLNFRFQ